jgi:asparagine synthase (glutamine-hydrolysing)
MCGIWSSLLADYQDASYYAGFKKTSVRGPDRSNFLELPDVKLMIGFHRLSIMDLSVHGDQPFSFYINENRTIYSICNGEIYNYKDLIKKYHLVTKSHSDCEVIPLLFLSQGFDVLCQELNGEYAFMLFDVDHLTKTYKVFISCDRFGIRPLFYANVNNSLVFSSEVKSIPFITETNNYNIKRFNPAHKMILTYENNKVEITNYEEYASIKNIKFNNDTEDIVKENIMTKLIHAVKARLMTDRPLGCLLSGGLDSSLVASIASRELAKENKQLRTFSVGLEGSTDEYYARLVAEHINSIHTHVVLEQKDWLDNLEKVVYTTETYDITTVRASTGQYLISKWIAENTDIKVLLIGDGSDELCSGYMYFHKAPSAQESHEENVRLVSDIHYYDVLRADRGVADNGLEARVPFLDNDFVDYYLSIKPELRIPREGLEKYLLRVSFDETKLLPKEVLYRKKEAFSDGVSSKEKSWFQIIQENANNLYSDEEFKMQQESYDHCVPPNKEALYFRKLYEKYFGTGPVYKLIPYFWLPKWCGNITEPSARVLEVYNE